MEIKINGKTADITVEHEKTIGEIIVSLDEWLANSGHRLSGLAIDGKTADISSIEEAFSREIDTVKVLDIHTSTLAALAAVSLLDLLGDIDEYEELGFEEKNGFYENWKERAGARFTAGQMPDLFLLYDNTFSPGADSGVSTAVLRSITEERLREVKEPAEEIKRLEPVIEDTCARLVDLPLDIQTGKDKRAAETIQYFSGITEKVFRIFRQLDIQGYIPEAMKTSENTFSPEIGEFGAVVKELLDAYERHDWVLVGDLAEYEIAPKLRELYNIIMKSCRETADAQGMK